MKRSISAAMVVAAAFFSVGCGPDYEPTPNAENEAVPTIDPAEQQQRGTDSDGGVIDGGP